MTTLTAITILEYHNLWRHGADYKMVNPKHLGEAIDLVVNKLKSEIE